MLSALLIKKEARELFLEGFFGFFWFGFVHFSS